MTKRSHGRVHSGSGPILRALLVLSLLVVAASCGAAPGGTTPVTGAPRKSVVLVGDSISQTSQPQLEAVFGVLFPWNFSMYALGGTTVADNRDAIRARVAYRPDVMVIELGTNDMAAINVGHPDVGTALGRYATAVGEMQGAMNDLATIRCVVWVNINTWSRIADDQIDLRTWGPVYNQRLLDEAALRPNMHIVDFAGQILAKGLPWMAANMDDNVLIHPDTVEGKQTVAAIMAQGVRNACGI